MGQGNILNIMKRNPNKFFSVDEIAKLVGLNVQTVYSAIRKLQNAEDIVFKEFTPAQGPIRKLYCYRVKDDYLAEIEHEFKFLKDQDKYALWPTSSILNVIMLRELKILSKRIKHLEELGENGTKR